MRLFNGLRVNVLMMLVMDMQMLVLHRFVSMQVLVSIFRNQPESGDHHCRRRQVQRVQVLA